MVPMQQTADELIPELRDHQRRLLIAGGAGLAVSLVGLWLNPRQFYQSYLSAYMWVLGIPLGCLALGMVHQLSGGAWGVVIRRQIGAASPTLSPPATPKATWCSASAWNHVPARAAVGHSRRGLEAVCGSPWDIAGDVYPENNRAALGGRLTKLIARGFLLDCGFLFNVGRAASHHRLDVTLSERSNLGQLLRAEIVVALTEVLHGIVEPFLLMFRQSFQDSTTQDMTEQLIPGLLERSGSRRGPPCGLTLRHSKCSPLGALKCDGNIT